MRESIGQADRGVLIEITAIGNAVKVVACDPASGREVAILGPAGYPRALLEGRAIAKLRAALRVPAELYERFDGARKP